MCAPSESRLAGDAVPDDCPVIEVRVAELRQLFHSNDPSPFRERDLDPAAERFIVDWSRELPSSILVGDWVGGFFAEHRPQENQVMQPRVDYAKAAPEVRAAMQTLDDHVRQTDLDRGLIELVKLRASLLNGCAYCVDMHTKIARALGETEQRLYAVSVWRETSF